MQYRWHHMRIHVLTDIRRKRLIDDRDSFNIVGVTVESTVVQCFMEVEHAQFQWTVQSQMSSAMSVT